MEILNLSFCEGTNIELSIPIDINGTFDIYNPKSNYYNNICSKATSENNTDIPLNDRKNEFIKNNLSLCEENCELIGYNNTNKKAKCSCNVKTDVSLDRIELDKNLLKNFLSIKKIMNIEIIKCFKIIFNINNIKNNYGFIFIFFIFILYLICLIIFYCKSLKNLTDEITKIIKAKNDSEYHITHNSQNYSDNNITQNDIKKAKLEFNSTTKKIKKDKSLFKKNKRVKKRNNKKKKKWKINNINDGKEKNKSILELTDSELNLLSYEEALKYDQRTYCQYYRSLLKKNQSILFSFYPNKDYNSQIIKSFLFFFFCVSDMAINALFFTDDTMHKIYTDSGLFNINYQLPQILYSFLISNGINTIIEYFSLTEEVIFSIKTKKDINLNVTKKLINCLKIKFCLFFIITFILLLIFWYYISCFCCIYQNTQIHLIIDSLTSFGFSLVYPFFVYLIPGIFRIAALRSKKSNKSCMYKFSQIFNIISILNL